MEKRFTSLSILEFQALFPGEDECIKYLADIKWAAGYGCKKCGHDRYCKGNGTYNRQCTSCRYIESPTAGTLFHRRKFSVLKAFYVVYYVATNKKGSAVPN